MCWVSKRSLTRYWVFSSRMICFRWNLIIAIYTVTVFKHAVHSFLVHVCWMLMALSAVEIVIVYVCVLVHLAAYRCHLLFTTCGMSAWRALHNFKLFLCIYIHFFIEAIHISEKNVNYWPLPSSQSIQCIICYIFPLGWETVETIWRIKGCIF